MEILIIFLLEKNAPKNIKSICKYNFAEILLKDLCENKEGKWDIISLRYFNPVGAHNSGLIGGNL